MPWHMERRNGDWCVVKDQDGTLEACHPTQVDALDQMAALYANEPTKGAIMETETAAPTPPAAAPADAPPTNAAPDDSADLTARMDALEQRVADCEAMMSEMMTADLMVEDIMPEEMV